MRVYVFVAIFISGVSICFAIRLRAKACNDTDFNGRDLLCTRVHKADLISDETQSHNVEHAENEAHLVEKEDEARMQDGALDSMLEKLMLEWPELPINAMDRVDELIHEAPAVKKPRLESSPAYQFAQPQPIVIASYSNHPGDTIGRNLIAALEKSYYDEGKTPIDWLRNVQAYWIISNLDDSIEKYDSTKLLAFSTREVTPQPFVAQDVVELLHNLQGIPEFVSDVQRTMVLDSTFKPLVFGQWIENKFSPEKILEIFFGHKAVDIKVTDQLFLAWLEYFTLYWGSASNKSRSRYDDFLKALRKYLPEKNLDEMIGSQEFEEAFLKQGDGVRGDFIRIRWTWLIDFSLRNKLRPDDAFSKINKKTHYLDNPNSPVLLWMLNYVVRYRKQSTFTDIELFTFLISKLSFESLMKL
ncbi:hypothetical protein Plhal304r1_c031g0101291 [Plasmopara halstedii]